MKKSPYYKFWLVQMVLGILTLIIQIINIILLTR